ncbi:hypothetical protein [Prevotella jejuni]|uniref:hypothetical protein n=1 Tax=Prevotella jejuni TaxID=1177574 RepID=UPI00352FAFA9
MAKTSSNEIPDFKEWLKGNGNLTPDSANNYITYLSASYNNVLRLNPTDNVYNYMDVIKQFYQAGDMLYAVTVINNIIERISVLGTPLPKDLNNQRSALKKLRVFLHYKRKNNVVDRTYLSKKNTNNPTSSTLDDTRDSFSKDSLDKIDGIRSLIDLIDTLGEKTFIKLVIESSFFFDKKIVDDQRNDIFKKLGEQPIPARKTTKTQSGIPEVGVNTKIGNLDIYQINGCNIPVELDGDGNEQVRKLIRSKTGYTISEGNCIFKNYIISHIWGKAYDPRYFTNFWNIVIVPAWANSLLDKNSDDEDSIEYKLKETFKKICVKLYGLDDPQFSEEWDDMASRMGATSNEKIHSNISKDSTYQISVIHEKNDGAGLWYGSHQVGRIILQNI